MSKVYKSIKHIAYGIILTAFFVAVPRLTTKYVNFQEMFGFEGLRILQLGIFILALANFLVPLIIAVGGDLN